MTPVIDFDAMQTQLGGDEELIGEVIAIFLEDYPARLQAIDAAIQRANAADIRAAAHALKGGASNLCAASVVKQAGALESAAASGDVVSSSDRFNALSAEVERLAQLLREFQTRRPH